MESYSTKSHIRCVVWRYLKTRSCHKGDITLKFCFYGHHLPSQHLEEDINQLWPTLLSIIESALRIQIPDALFSEILHNNTLGARDFSSAVSGFCQVFLARKTYGTQGSTTIETCWIESINLGHNARFFATLTKIGKYIKFNNEAEKHTWSRNKNQMDASLWEGNLLQYGFTCFKMADVISSLALPNRTMGTWRVYTE